MAHPGYMIATIALMLSITGCSAVMKFPNIAPTVSENSKNAPWPEFLPTATLVAEKAIDPKLVASQAQSLDARIIQLRRRAKALRAPLAEAQENLRRLRVAKRHNP